MRDIAEDYPRVEIDRKQAELHQLLKEEAELHGAARDEINEQVIRLRQEIEELQSAPSGAITHPHTGDIGLLSSIKGVWRNLTRPDHHDL